MTNSNTDHLHKLANPNSYFFCPNCRKESIIWDYEVFYICPDCEYSPPQEPVDLDEEAFYREERGLMID